MIFNVGKGGGKPYWEHDTTIPAGNTGISFYDNRFSEDSVIEIFTDKYGVNPTEVTLSYSGDGEYLLFVQFERQTTDLKVKVRVS